jgi:spermidine synthase
LRIAVFGCGAALMALEVLGSRVLAPFFGSDLYVWGSLIGIFLTALSLGYWIGGWSADRWPSPRTLAVFLGAAGALTLLISPVKQPICNAIVMVHFGPRLDPLLAAVSLFFLPSLCYGTVTPIAIRLAAREIGGVGGVAGGMAAISTVGSIVGTFATAFFLIPNFPVTATIYAIGLLVIALAVLTAILPTGRRTPPLVAVLLVLAAIGPACAQTTVFERDSAYHHIRVVDEGEYRTLYFDDARQTRMLRSDPLAGNFEYTDYFHMTLLLNSAIKRAAFIGLGGGTGPHRFLKDYPAMQIQVAEIDPVVVQVARKFFALPESPRLKVSVQDGRVFLQRSREKFDLVVLDAYTKGQYGSTVPWHLTTKEFFQQAARVMTPQGVLVFNVTAYPTGPKSKITRAIYKTITSVFPICCYFTATSSTNTVLIAARSGPSLTKDVAKAKAESLVKRNVVSLPHFLDRAERFANAPMATGDVPLLTDDYAPVEALMAGP